MSAEIPGTQKKTANPSENNPGKPSSPRFAFMDATEAAANLRTDRLGVLKLIEEGRLKTFGGRPTNPFVRSEEVARLAQELLGETAEQGSLDPKTVHRNDPVRKLKLRIQQDAKWPEVDETAIRAWAGELDPISYNRMKKVAHDAIERLQLVIKVLDETTAKPRQIPLSGSKKAGQ